jgi:hypothetical protein
MTELSNIKSAVQPQEILLVVDAMTGQDAVNVAESFNNLLNIDGVVLTKLDGDTRGGAALSVKYITGKPIKFAGTGEKLDQIEQFHPDRMASRILGMGDVLSLIDKAQASIDLDEEKGREMAGRMKKGKFDFEDYLESMKQMRNMGGLSSILSMMPGMGAKMGDIESMVDEKQLARIVACFPDGLNKLQMIDYLSDNDNLSFKERLAHYLPIIQYHDRWGELTYQDFEPNPELYKCGSAYGSFLKKSTRIDSEWIFIICDKVFLFGIQVRK